MKIHAQTPPVLGWLEVDLDEEDVEYLWERIEAAKKQNLSAKPILAGNITAVSYTHLTLPTKA